jgi:hypothetical protein
LFSEFEIGNKLPNPLAMEIKTSLKYNDVLNYFSELNSK